MNITFALLMVFFLGMMALPAIIVVVAILMPEGRTYFAAWRWQSAHILLWLTGVFTWDADRAAIDDDCRALTNKYVAMKSQIDHLAAKDRAAREAKL